MMRCSDSWVALLQIVTICFSVFASAVWFEAIEQKLGRIEQGVEQIHKEWDERQ